MVKIFDLKSTFLLFTYYLCFSMAIFAELFNPLDLICHGCTVDIIRLCSFNRIKTHLIRSRLYNENIINYLKFTVYE